MLPRIPEDVRMSETLIKRVRSLSQILKEEKPTVQYKLDIKYQFQKVLPKPKTQQPDPKLPTNFNFKVDLKGLSKLVTT
jgi:hypothetical protein